MPEALICKFGLLLQSIWEMIVLLVWAKDKIEDTDHILYWPNASKDHGPTHSHLITFYLPHTIMADKFPAFFLDIPF